MVWIYSLGSGRYSRNVVGFLEVPASSLEIDWHFQLCVLYFHKPTGALNLSPVSFSIPGVAVYGGRWLDPSSIDSHYRDFFTGLSALFIDSVGPERTKQRCLTGDQGTFPVIISSSYSSS